MEALNFETLLDIIAYGNDKLTIVFEEIIRHKHSACLNRIIFKSPDGRFWETSYWRDFNNGIEDDGPFEVYEVEEIQTIAYRRKQ